MKTVTYYLLYSVSLLFALLPLRILYLISNGFYYLIYYIIGYRKNTVFTNLRNSFPEKSEKEIEVIAKKFYLHLCDLFVETIKLLHFPDKENERRIKLKNPEIIEEVYSKHNMILVALGHYNNWEWISTMSKPNFSIASLYKPLHNESVDRFMLKLRSRKGSILVPTTQSLRFLSSWKNSDKKLFYCFIADQSPLLKDIHYWTQFLNQKTPIFIGIEKIAVKMDLPVCFFRLHKIKRGYYELEIVPITEKSSETKPFEITEAHVRLLEEDIKRAPEFWLWSHRRWKRKIPENNLNQTSNA